MQKKLCLRYLRSGIVLILLTGIALHGFGQTSKTISGLVVDDSTGLAVQFATVALTDTTGKILDGVTCDEEGKFVIANSSRGTFRVVVSFVGYQSKTVSIQIPPGPQGFLLGVIRLAISANTLNEVVVRSAKPMVEETEDGYTYNAENDLNAAGGTASDLLRNVPGISVDMDGNLEMQGSTKIKILIDGKPSAIMAGNIAEALQQIPANLIEKVEVITTPSAKYDAEGTGGIVNIITKKTSTLEGYRGGLNVTGGNRSNGVNGNLTSRLGKLGLRGSFGGNLNRNFGDGENEQLYYAQRQLSQISEFRNDGQGANGILGADIDFNAKNTLNSTLRFSKYNSINSRSSRTLVKSTIPEHFGDVISNDLNKTDSKSATGSIDSNLDYTHKFKNKGQELNVIALYSRNNKDGDNYTVRKNKDQIVNQRLQNDNEASTREISAQADYVQPLKKWGKIETGGKAILRNNQSNYRLSAAYTPDAPLVTDPLRTNLFIYDQEVYSSYLSYGFQIKKKFNFRFGGRYEFTRIAADFISNDTTLKKPYRTFMPNVTASVRLKGSQRVSFNYSSQIFRPQIEYLNPYRDDSNERSIRIGNPDLLPEMTHNWQLTYSKYLKTITVNGSLYWRQTDNNIGQYRTSDRVRSRVADHDNNPANDSLDAITTTYLNLGSNITAGTNISVSGRVFKTAQIGSNVSFYYNEINGFVFSNQLKRGVPVVKGSWMYSVQLNGSFYIPKEYSGPLKGMSTQMTAAINSPRLNLQGKSSSFQRYSISIRKEFLVRQQSKDKVGINLSIENFLNAGNRMRTLTTTDQFTSTSIQTQYNRIFRLGLTYNFSRMEYKIKPVKEEKAIVSEDLKKIDLGEVKDIKVDATENGKGSDRKPKPATKEHTKATKK